MPYTLFGSCTKEIRLTLAAKLPGRMSLFAFRPGIKDDEKELLLENVLFEEEL